MLYARLEAALAAQGVTRKGSAPVLVACSGGPDSIALAHVATKLLGAPRVVLGHVDHGVRAGATEDAAAVEAWGRSLGLEVRAVRLEGVADDEASLREARYAALEVMRLESGAAWTLTAHSADDQAETVLLALISRTHADALRGMPAVRDRILRPWLSVPRADIWAHVARHRLPARWDASNVEPRYARNRVRKELLPLLESRYRPGIAKRLAALAATLAEGPDAPPMPSPETTDQARPPGAPPPPVWFAHRAWPPGGSIPDGHGQVVFDAAEVETVRIRALAPGDRIRPFGLNGHRKVRDVLREAGIPESDRPLRQVVTDAEDRVLWVPGLLRSSHAPVGVKTKFVWHCGVERNDELRGDASRANLDGAAPGAYVPDREIYE